MKFFTMWTCVLFFAFFWQTNARSTTFSTVNPGISFDKNNKRLTSEKNTPEAKNTSKQTTPQSTSNSLNGYCEPSPIGASYGIATFVTTGAYQNINDQDAGGSGYNDNTDLYVSHEASSSFDFNATSTSSSLGVYFSVFIDYDQDTEFQESERIYSSTEQESSISGTITIPPGTANSDYRLRIITDRLQMDPDPCDITLGGVADYTLRVMDIASCFPPSNITFGHIAANSAEISWTPGSSEDQWEVIHGTPGFDPETGGTSQIVNGSPNTTIAGLSPETSYDVYVRAKCGGSDGDSEFVGPEAFTTPCAGASIPFAEGFENGNSNGDPLAGCWTQESIEGTEGWIANTSLHTLNRSPRTGDWNVILKLNQTTWMFYPLELVGGVTYELEFYARQDDSDDIANVSASYGISDDADAMIHEIIPATDLTGGDYQRIANIFTPDTSGTYYIGIKGDIGFPPFSIALDDLSVTEYTTICMPPSDIQVDNIEQTTAEVDWTHGGYETEWEVKYGDLGFDPDTAGNSEMVNDTPNITLSDLSSNTEYDIYIRAVCSSGDTSVWEGPETFMTLCGIAEVPFTQNFESAYIPDLPNCGSSETNNGDGWTVSQVENHGFDSQVLRHDFNLPGEGSIDSWYFTQGVNMETDKEYVISFKYGNNSASYYTEKLTVAFGSDTLSSAMTHEVIELNNIEGASSEVAEITFSVPQDGVYYFGFQANSDEGQSSLFVDDIHIDNYQFCEQGNNSNDFEMVFPITAGIQEETADDFFVTAGNTLNVKTIALNILTDEAPNQIDFTFYEDDNGAPGDMLPQSVTNYPDSEHIVFIGASSGYDAYRVYVDVDLEFEGGADGAAYWIQPTATNSGLPIYWEVSSAGNLGEPLHRRESGGAWLADADGYQSVFTLYCEQTDPVIPELPCFQITETIEPITRVAFSNIDNVTDATVNGTPALEDFTHLVAEVDPGSSYQVVAEGNTVVGGYPFTNYFTLFIDYSDDTQDAWTTYESYQIGSIYNSTGTDGEQASTTITIDESIPAGTYTMRVIKMQSSGIYPDDPCGFYGWGQAEDYLINVSGPSCPAPTDLSVEVENTTVEVNWTANGSETEWELIYGAPGFNPEDGEGESVFVQNNPATITDLDPDTDYEIYVRAICGQNDQSLLEGPVSFSTGVLSVDTPSFETFTFYPNPTQSKLNLSANMPINRVTLHNTLGQQVIDVRPESTRSHINLEGLQTGVYFMKVTLDGKQKTYKVIKR